MLCRISWQSFSNQDKQLEDVFDTYGCILDLDLLEVETVQDLFDDINNKTMRHKALGIKTFESRNHIELNHHLYIEVLRTSDKITMNQMAPDDGFMPTGSWNFNIHFIY